LLKIALISETFSPKMGYAQSNLSKALAKLGEDVHLITTNLNPYHNINDFDKTYGKFLNNKDQKLTYELIDGYHVHYLPHTKKLGYIKIVGLFDKLKSLKPDIVQTFAVISWIPLDAALASPLLKYRLFTGSHYHISVFPLAQKKSRIWQIQFIKSVLTRAIPGRFISYFTEKCYPITNDCAYLAIKYFGVQEKKVKVSPLGVDIDLFKPITNDHDQYDRKNTRYEMGFSDTDIVCLYTGRFSNEKNPIILAKAVSYLHSKGEPYKGLFIGGGIQEDMIKEMKGCIVHPFVNFTELPKFYRASDIGVWPTQESMSMLDASACGLPIIVNDTLYATERVEGNGIMYKLNDVDDMVQALLDLKEKPVRYKLGTFGADKMKNNYSWESIAKNRLLDYQASLVK
jgi:glycosyltransferase involved in cell wall biosynthesis